MCKPYMTVDYFAERSALIGFGFPDLSLFQLCKSIYKDLLQMQAN